VLNDRKKTGQLLTGESLDSPKVRLCTHSGGGHLILLEREFSEVLDGALAGSCVYCEQWAIRSLLDMGKLTFRLDESAFCDVITSPTISQKKKKKKKKTEIGKKEEAGYLSP